MDEPVILYKGSVTVETHHYISPDFIHWVEWQPDVDRDELLDSMVCDDPECPHHP